jgi:hypothetical protein
MAQNFVLAFGGTGARCAEALLYLIACGAISDPAHILLVDPDETNGNVRNSIEQIRRYQTIQRHAGDSNRKDSSGFFATPVNEDLGPESGVWANPQANTQFRTLIQYNAQNEVERGLIDLLYDEDDLDLSFEHGYVGRAHIGSLDLLRTLQSQIQSAANQADTSQAPPPRDSLQSFFVALRAATQRPGGARLLVVGSVFGGTGASGLPAVPPLLREVLLSGLQRELHIGCIQVAPYFSFPPGKEEDPDSAIHPLATQAALYHYSLTNVGYDRIYLVGAPNREQSNHHNARGGTQQNNRSHYVELAAALAAAHFFSRPPVHGATEVLACGADEVSWDKLPFRNETNVRKKLSAFATFCLVHASFLAKVLEERRHVGSKWMADLAARRNRTLGGQEPELKELREFSLRFLAWAEDLQRVSDVDLFSLSNRESPESLSSVVSGGRSERPYHAIYSRLAAVGVLDKETGVGWYVAALGIAVNNFCRSNYQSWWA